MGTQAHEAPSVLDQDTRKVQQTSWSARAKGIAVLCCVIFILASAVVHDQPHDLSTMTYVIDLPPNPNPPPRVVYKALPPSDPDVWRKWVFCPRKPCID